MKVIFDYLIVKRSNPHLIAVNLFLTSLTCPWCPLQPCQLRAGLICAAFEVQCGIMGKNTSLEWMSQDSDLTTLNVR